MSTRTTGRLGAMTASWTVLRGVGALEVLIGGLMVAPLLVSLLHQEWLLAVLPSDFTLADAVFELATAQGTVGLSSGLTRPEMPDVGEILTIFTRDGASDRITDTFTRS